MPQFGDFVLDSVPGNENYVRLNWTDNSGNGYLFDPDQISDGSLRFMALATLLLQPPELFGRPAMIRLHITAEGQTEQSFARNVLAPHLAMNDYVDMVTCLRISNF